MKVQYLKESQ